MADTQSLSDWLAAYGQTKALDDRSWLKGTGLDSPDAFNQARTFHSDDSGLAPDAGFSEATQQALKRVANYSVSPIGETSDRSFFAVKSPDGKTKQVSLQKAKDDLLAKVMYSGAPIALMAGPIGAAMGLTGAAAAAAGGAITGGIQGFMASEGNLKNTLRGAAAGGIGGATAMIPGISSLGSVGQGAVSGGLRSLLTGGNSRETLLSALMGGISGGAAKVNPLVRQVAIAQLRAKLMPTPRRG
jgi:hypothetical protein